MRPSTLCAGQKSDSVMSVINHNCFLSPPCLEFEMCFPLEPSKNSLIYLFYFFNQIWNKDVCVGEGCYTHVHSAFWVGVYVGSCKSVHKAYLHVAQLWSSIITKLSLTEEWGCVRGSNLVDSRSAHVAQTFNLKLSHLERSRSPGKWLFQHQIPKKQLFPSRTCDLLSWLIRIIAGKKILSFFF